MKIIVIDIILIMRNAYKNTVNFKIKFSFVSILSMQFGCVSLQKTTSYTKTDENETIHLMEDLSEEERDLTIEESLPVRDTLEADICFDSEYANYLIESYSNSKRTVKGSSKLNRTQALRREHEAYYHVRSLLSPVAEQPIRSSLPIVENDRVEFWLQYFKGRGRNTFLKWLHRAEEIRELVVPVLREEQVPEELFFLAMIESGFNNTVASRAKATGTWQFMAPTARHFGLKIDHWVDERRDPAKSTRAAARYFKELYAQFGDWYLAMAAYNAGPGKIRSAIKRSKTNDFWKISETNTIRSETKHYVPKVLAAIKLANMESKNAGFALSETRPAPSSLLTIEIEDPIDLRELAETTDVSHEMLTKWNPELLQGISPPQRSKDGTYELKVSEDVKAEVQAALPLLSKLEITDVKLHIISAGDTLSKIARKYKVSLQKILQFNPGFKASLLKVGKSIAIPIPGIVRKTHSDQDRDNGVPEFG